MALIECPDCRAQISDAAPSCIHCGRPLRAQPVDTSAKPTMLPEPQVTPVSWSATPFTVNAPWKLVLMSVVTFNLYILQWFYENWRRIKERDGSSVWPAARAFFCIFFASSMFSRVRAATTAGGVKAHWHPVAVSGVFIVLVLLVRLPDPYWLVTFAAVWPLLPVQRTMNALAGESVAVERLRRRFSLGQIIALVIGGFFWLSVFADAATRR